MPSVEQGEPAAKPAEQLRDFVNEARSAVAIEQGQPASLPAQSSQATAPATAPATPASPVNPAAARPAGGTTAAWMPQIADDVDLIEKEWVDKAKEIVAQTAHDPYLQNKEMNKVKAEYLKKRYNKDIKQSD